MSEQIWQKKHNKSYVDYYILNGDAIPHIESKSYIKLSVETVHRRAPQDDS